MEFAVLNRSLLLLVILVCLERSQALTPCNATMYCSQDECCKSDEQLPQGQIPRSGYCSPRPIVGDSCYGNKENSFFMFDSLTVYQSGCPCVSVARCQDQSGHLLTEDLEGTCVGIYIG